MGWGGVWRAAHWTSSRMPSWPLALNSSLRKTRRCACREHITYLHEVAGCVRSWRSSGWLVVWVRRVVRGGDAHDILRVQLVAGVDHVLQPHERRLGDDHHHEGVAAVGLGGDARKALDRGRRGRDGEGGRRRCARRQHRVGLRRAEAARVEGVQELIVHRASSFATDAFATDAIASLSLAKLFSSSTSMALTLAALARPARAPHRITRRRVATRRSRALG